MATSILMALGSCRRIISASMGRARCSQVAGEPCRHRPGWREAVPAPEATQGPREAQVRPDWVWRGPEGLSWPVKSLEQEGSLREWELGGAGGGLRSECRSAG